MLTHSWFRMIYGLGLFLLIWSASPSRADSIFYESCLDKMSSFEDEGARIQLVADSGGFAGLSCQQLKSAIDAFHIMSMALMPVTVALRAPGAKEQLAASLATYGLSMANPAVLGVTIIGATGVVTLYFIMKNSLQECERRDQEELRKNILRDLKKAYPGLAGDNASLNLQGE